MCQKRRINNKLHELEELMSASPEPAWGSVNAIVPENRPPSIAGRNCSTNSGLANVRMTLAAAIVRNG